LNLLHVQQDHWLTSFDPVNSEGGWSRTQVLSLSAIFVGLFGTILTAYLAAVYNTRIQRRAQTHTEEVDVEVGQRSLDQEAAEVLAHGLPDTRSYTSIELEVLETVRRETPVDNFEARELTPLPLPPPRAHLNRFPERERYDRPRHSL
jgi:hypothetical protein